MPRWECISRTWAVPVLEQKTVVKKIRGAACNQVGLMLNGDDPEYLWWVQLGAPNPGLRIEWIVSGTPLGPIHRPRLQTVCRGLQFLPG